jgi:uncharacterized protein YbjT (DUF2867 family)
MRILLTGSNGYIGSRLLQMLLDEGHEIIAMVRAPSPPLPLAPSTPRLTIVIADLLHPETLQAIPREIDVAYYLVHSMTGNRGNFLEAEIQAITHFLELMKQSSVKQIIYLSGLTSDTPQSQHFVSRHHVECTIRQSGLPYTILRAGIIIGAGSASFEIIRDLTEKLPVMVAPIWVSNLCQPIAIRDILHYLIKVIGSEACRNETFDVGGPEAISYKEMLLEYANERHLKRHIFVLPFLTPHLSAYWLYFITSVNFRLASALVDSLKSNAICHDRRITKIFPHNCLSYRASIREAFDIVEQSTLIPSWKDSIGSAELAKKLSQTGTIPHFGCLIDKRIVISTLSREQLLLRIWSIGGQNGWYSMNWAWGIRGFIDKLCGGVGLQRGRSHPTEITTGSSLDFWRVAIADKQAGHLLLYAEMKLPGEAWLEFRIYPCNSGKWIFEQTASFRPKGLLGRLYWYAMWPFHHILFGNMAKKIAMGSTLS